MEYNLKQIGAKTYEKRKMMGFTLEEVGNMVGVAKSTSQRYEAGKITAPKLAVLESIARALDMDIRELTGMALTPKNLRPLQRAQSKTAVPILGKVAAGEGAFADSNIQGYIMEDSSGLNSADEYAYLKVEGDSMYPEFKDGDMVLVKCSGVADTGDYAVVMVDGDNGVIKRIEYGEESIILHSINPMYPPRKFEGREMLRTRIFGVVKGLRRAF